jgi:hypothetical protein
MSEVFLHDTLPWASTLDVKYQNQEESKVKYIKNVEFRSPNLEHTYILQNPKKTSFNMEGPFPC